MIVRAEGLSPSMSQYLVDRIVATPNIEVLNRVEVETVCGTGRLERVVVRNVDTREMRELDSSAMFIFIGTKPRSDMVTGLLELDEKGFILTGPDLSRTDRGPRGWTLNREPFLFETSVPGIFAVGDVRAGASRRVAAAVGEGSASIYMVHRYLETV